MPKELINGVTVKKLSIHCDERGRLMEMLRADDKECNNIKFGQIYMTTAYPGVTKAWHYHKKQTDHFVCVRGMMKVVIPKHVQTETLLIAWPDQLRVLRFIFGDQKDLASTGGGTAR